MKSPGLCTIVGAVFFLTPIFFSIDSRGDLIEFGNLNRIDQIGNASNGISFLDISVSNNKTAAQALIDAQALYSDARFATPAEWDDLFDAANITGYTSTLRASDAFTNTTTQAITTFSVEVRTLSEKLGFTNAATSELNNDTYLFSDPDGSSGGTADYLVLRGPRTGVDDDKSQAIVANFAFTPGPGTNSAWLIVTSIPEPSSVILSLLAMGLTVFARRKRRKFSIA